MRESDRVRSRARHVVLVGLMGSGKTTIGARVAAALGWPLRDSDPEIEARVGRTVRELQDAIGVERMHSLEAAHLLESLAGGEPTVIAAAASVIEEEASRDALGAPDVLVVWLRASPSTLGDRFEERRHRPAYGVDRETFLADQARRRDALYEAVADIVVRTDTTSPDEAAARIVAEVAR